jgi:beta-lactamase regulating signal transducer with metallopeptidase domain
MRLPDNPCLQDDWSDLAPPPVQQSGAAVEATMAEPVESVAVPGERLTWQGGALLLWGVGVLGFIVLVIRRVFFVRRLMARGRPAEGDPIDLLDECRGRMNIRGQVALKLLPGTFSPAVCGLWRPTILLPQTLPARLAPDNLRAVLIHELAHIKRADLWVNCLQTVLQIIYFYNPLVWLANAIVRRVREQAVDEMALVALGAEARSYGNTLIDIAEMTFWRANPALRLVGVAESKRSLEGRIRHMITRPIPKNARSGYQGSACHWRWGRRVPMAAARTGDAGREVRGQLASAQRSSWWASAPGRHRTPSAGRRMDRDCDPGMHPNRWSSNPRADNYGFMVQVTGPDAPELLWNSIEGAQGRVGESDVVDRQASRCRVVGRPPPGGPAKPRSGGRAAGARTMMASHNAMA